MISHMQPAVRQRCEKDLIVVYHQAVQTELRLTLTLSLRLSLRLTPTILMQAVQAELRRMGKDSQAEAFTFESCWSEYVAGGAGRWIWLLAVLIGRVPPSMGQYFHDQVAAFLHDHIKSPGDAPMPRV